MHASVSCDATRPATQTLPMHNYALRFLWNSGKPSKLISKHSLIFKFKTLYFSVPIFPISLSPILLFHYSLIPYSLIPYSRIPILSIPIPKLLLPINYAHIPVLLLQFYYSNYTIPVLTSLIYCSKLNVRHFKFYVLNFKFRLLNFNYLGFNFQIITGVSPNIPGTTC